MWFRFFTNIPLNLAIKSIEKRWNYISECCSVLKDEFLLVIQFVLESTSFDNQIYKQNFGTPVDSSLSIIADMIMNDLEKNRYKKRYI